MRGPRKSRRVQNRNSTNPSSSAEESFPIVGVGASAGGLGAISQLLQNIPEKPGLAFLLVQHLDPTHPSTLAELLSRKSRIPIEEVQEGVAVERDHAYVIPPNTEMTLRRGSLHLAPRQPRGAVSMPVDRLFLSLATDRGHRAIGVVLSGTGSDGMEGCKAIKEAGGIVFAQTDASAQYSGMPQSTVNSGSADFVLPPNEIAARLIQIGSHPYVRQESNPLPMAYEPHDLNTVFEVVSAKTGVDFSQYKPTMLLRRIQRRMALHKFGDLKDYLRYLKDNGDEAEALHSDVLITVTNFFREPEAFEALKTFVLKPILAERDRKNGLRIWVPGCATGEEPYSLAMALMECLSEGPPKLPHPPIQIFGSDVNEASLAKARLGLYSGAILGDLTSERLERFFVRQDGEYHVHKSIRELCVFAKQNVVKDPPFSNLDLISCRNLLIYFGESLQTRVIPTFHYALRPGAYLMLGSSETLGQFADQFAIVDKKNKIYQKKKNSPRLLTYFVNAGAAGPPPMTPSPARVQTSGQSLERLFDRALLETTGSSSIVVTDEMEIVHLRGNTNQYLMPGSGQPSFNLNKMTRPDLLFELRKTLKAAKTSGRPISRGNVEIQTEHGSLRIDINVRPHTPAMSRERYYLISLREVASKKRSRQRERADKQTQPGSVRVREELAQAKDHIKSMVEDHDAVLEEYRSANEEVLSSNEELQSLNEEMETAKEELQSTNEELRTLNEELQNRNLALAAAYDDVNNLLLNANIPMLMVNNELMIRRFTPQAQLLLNLGENNTSQKITDLHGNLRGVNLADIAREVIASISPVEMEVQAKDGTWYLLRVRAFKTAGHVIAGAVFMFQDIDLLKRSLDESRSYTSTLIDSARESILILDSRLRVITANHAFYKRFLVEPAETEKRFLYELGNGQWNVPQLRKLLEEILPTQTRINDFELRAEFPTIGQRIMVLNGRRIESQMGNEVILLAIEDVTEFKRSEAALRQLSNRLLKTEDAERRRIARDLHDVTGQKVASLALNVRLLAKQVPEAEKNKLVSETLELTGQITTDIRSMSYILHPPMLDELGLVPALREYVEGVSERTGLQIHLSVGDGYPDLPDDIEITIFRIVQECLTNIHRHSGSSDATIDLMHANHELEVRVVDSGHGFPVEGVSNLGGGSNKHGVGMASMKERVRHVGGTFQVESNDKGTMISARIPIPDGHM